MASNQDLYRNFTDEKFVFYVGLAHDIFIRHFWNDQVCEHNITRSEKHSEELFGNVAFRVQSQTSHLFQDWTISSMTQKHFHCSLMNLKTQFHGIC